MNADHDRDRRLEDALKHELRAAGSAPAPSSCLDAETVAAWMDGGLDSQAIVMAEAHASNCARCQALLGTLAQTVPAAAVPEPRTARLWRWWFAPLAATAAAVTVWMVVPQDRLTAPAAPTAAESTAPEAKTEASTSREIAEAPATLAEAVAPKREAPAFEARERPAAAATRADAAAVGQVAEAAKPAAPSVGLRSQADLVADPQVTARSSPSPNVIWSVGRGGMVMLATDGRTFLRVPFPETVDLTAVTAADDRRAVVTAADGRTFQTADGGRTWQRRP
ncbi:MAG: hypothetical protein Q8O42_02570 [Acidobacteriota bacterium]|nr:hypothetical protein [Acidobacteriota bacterium]